MGQRDFISDLIALNGTKCKKTVVNGISRVWLNSYDGPENTNRHLGVVVGSIIIEFAEYEHR